MNQTLEISLLAMIVLPVIALAGCIHIERDQKAARDRVLEPTEGAGARPEFKLVPSREQRLIPKTPTDILLQVRQRTDTKTLKR